VPGRLGWGRASRTTALMAAGTAVAGFVCLVYAAYHLLADRRPAGWERSGPHRRRLRSAAHAQRAIPLQRPRHEARHRPVAHAAAADRDETTIVRQGRDLVHVDHLGQRRRGSRSRTSRSSAWSASVAIGPSVTVSPGQRSAWFSGKPSRTNSHCHGEERTADPRACLSHVDSSDVAVHIMDALAARTCTPQQLAHLASSAILWEAPGRNAAEDNRGPRAARTSAALIRTPRLPDYLNPEMIIDPIV
jgi:hypothetical protein